MLGSCCLESNSILWTDIRFIMSLLTVIVFHITVELFVTI